MIHPAEEATENFLEFHGANVRAIDGNERGAVTIEMLKLNRPAILERRLDALAILVKGKLETRELLCTLLARDSDPVIANEIVAIDERLEKSVVDAAEYAAMVRAVLKDRSQLVD